MATKLEVIQHRRQGRDYIDIAAMDRAGACTIEDGLRYHKQRYAPIVTYEETLRIARLATSPPPTDPDPAFDRKLAEAASHLAARRRAVLDWPPIRGSGHAHHSPNPPHTNSDPPSRTRPKERSPDSPPTSAHSSITKAASFLNRLRKLLPARSRALASPETTQSREGQ